MASVTGPIFPFLVESKVEQYLKINCSHPQSFNHERAFKLSDIASSIGMVLVLRAITAASVGSFFISEGSRVGIPAYMDTCIPDFLRLFAISDEPVKSSPIIPSFIIRSLFYNACFSNCVTIFSLTQGVTSSLND